MPGETSAVARLERWIAQHRGNLGAALLSDEGALLRVEASLADQDGLTSEQRRQAAAVGMIDFPLSSRFVARAARALATLTDIPSWFQYCDVLDPSGPVPGRDSVRVGADFRLVDGRLRMLGEHWGSLEALLEAVPVPDAPCPRGAEHAINDVIHELLHSLGEMPLWWALAQIDADRPASWTDVTEGVMEVGSMAHGPWLIHELGLSDRFPELVAWLNELPVGYDVECDFTIGLIHGIAESTGAANAEVLKTLLAHWGEPGGFDRVVSDHLERSSLFVSIANVEKLTDAMAARLPQLLAEDARQSLTVQAAYQVGFDAAQTGFRLAEQLGRQPLSPPATGRREPPTGTELD